MAESQNGRITAHEVYNSIDSMRKELLDSIHRLEDKFDTLEAGRLSQLERDFARFQGKMAVIYIGVSSTVALIVTYFFNLLVN